MGRGFKEIEALPHQQSLSNLPGGPKFREIKEVHDLIAVEIADHACLPA